MSRNDANTILDLQDEIQLLESHIKLMEGTEELIIIDDETNEEIVVGLSR